MSNPNCPYCGTSAALVGGDAIYPHRRDLYALKFWQCAGCDAYTGTHKGSKKHAPKGGLANAELRRARVLAHAAFDPIWRNGDMSRGAAYKLLQEWLEMDTQPHIGFMNEAQCAEVVQVCVR